MSLTGVTAGFACVRWSGGSAKGHALVLFEVAQLAMAHPSRLARSSFSTLRIMVTKNRRAQTATCHRKEPRALDRARASGPSGVTTNQTPTVSDNANGLTVEQENAIPYRPCMEAYGWVNGRLRCGNN
jgi:hypothetical protein